MGAFCWITFVVANVAFLPLLEARPNDCYEVGGFLAPVFAPIGDDGNLTLDVISQYAQYLKDKGVNGVIVGGATGEGPALNLTESKNLLHAWMEAAPPLNLFVISSIGGVPFPDTLEMARYSEELGVDAIFASPEVYYKPRTAEELVYYMELIAEAAPETPLVYDDVPQYTGVFVNIVRFYELATEKINTFRGVRSSVFENLLRLRTKTRDQQKLYASNYFYLAAEVFLGFKNFVLSELNFFPELIFKIVTNGQKRNLTRSINYYQHLVDLVDVITERGEIIAAYKATMPLVSGVDVGGPRKPRYPLYYYDTQNLETRLRENNVKIVNSDTSYID